MTLIEGVGDEVIQFVGALLLVIVALLAWWSTNARPDRYRAILVMRSHAPNPVTLRIRPRIIETINNHDPPPAAPATPNSADTIAIRTLEALEDPDNASAIPLQEMDSIVDADMAMLDNNRLHFFRRMDAPGDTQSLVEPTSDSENLDETDSSTNAQMREMDSIVDAMEADLSDTCECLRDHNAHPRGHMSNKKEAIPSTANASKDEADNGEQATSNNEDANQRKILIKLKYLNETLKEVDGSLDELLKDFKLRHFSSELSAECRVRLIFNGRVLGDEATLRACGLHHRAVVHCLVHPPRRAPHQRGNGEDGSLNNTHDILTTERAPAERTWELESVLFTLGSVALTFFWFIRCEYSNLFTASASVMLFVLTVLYSVGMFGLYMFERFNVDRRPTPPPVNN